ncbi:hypothetical protein ETAA8_25620 [Anatilimnocola aggregata]|uniref:Uncharacterized protein n=1 Tax=Anatilimnocola aggregata TaxID=2528021 RepID=A0A517YB91_9BACT|nr:hypothetical protein [Anatilimnocola aggregata]QDU27474.1 hypothetical protein ETAA8_25620 [Anatilimnocola aggregata]
MARQPAVEVEGVWRATKRKTERHTPGFDNGQPQLHQLRPGNLQGGRLEWFESGRITRRQLPGCTHGSEAATGTLSR